MRAGWVTQLVAADGTPVETLRTLRGGSQTFGPLGGDSPNRVQITIDQPLPDMTGLFIVDRWTGRDGPGEWYTPTAGPEQLNRTATRQLQGVDLTRLLSRAQLRREEVLERGEHIDERVLQLLARYVPTHRDRFRVADIDATIRAQQVYGVGEQLGRVTSEVLTAGGLTDWTPMAGGLVQSTPWVPPAERSDVAGFSDDSSPSTSPFLPGWDRDAGDVAPKVNEVLVRCRGESGDALIVGRWADEAAIARHGPVADITDGEASDQAAADLLARRRAEELRARTRIRFTGRWTPMRQGQVCPVTWSRWGIRSRFELISKDVARTPAALTTYEMAEV